MVENPEIGGQYWFVTDIWERFCPVPVTIVAVNEEYGAFLVRWDIGESEYFEQYEGVWPNGGSRKKAEAGRFRAEGVKAGVPDLCLPVARGGFHGLYIELKRQKGSKTSDDQKAWLSNLEKQGYFVALCKGWEAAAKVITEYLTMGGKKG